MNNAFDEIVSEVSQLNQVFLRMATDSSSVARTYKGCHILLSRLVINPEIMIIGINPGGKSSGTKLTPYKENAYKYNFMLAKETRKLLRLSGVPVSSQWLDECVIKTNHHYFATKNLEDLHALYGNLIWSENNPHIKANDWTKRLIRLINPKLILCEGAEAFKGVHYSLTGQKYHNRLVGDVWEAEALGYRLIGYRRLYSYVVNKPLTARVIRKNMQF